MARIRNELDSNGKFQPPERDALGRPKKGFSLNPDGSRAKKRFSVKGKILKYLQETHGKSKDADGNPISKLDAVVHKLIDVSLEKGDRAMLLKILEYVEPKVAQAHLSVTTGPFANIPSDELQEIVNEAQEAELN